MKKINHVYLGSELVDFRIGEMTLLEKISWHVRLLLGREQPYTVTR